MLVGCKTLAALFAMAPPPNGVARVTGVNHFMLGMTAMWAFHKR